ncbi:hypothetical protein EUTSA_v10009291mg [Eutrema salsugineum]|uniref:C3H1-type domain-containing protein n=1 Tax=Eutrema salsugineum TaxID=72664 RepID=V4K8E3_EUTSA|nr:hypothetical protein EUTSA_v10009291mg [Eutrema salsugineum]
MTDEIVERFKRAKKEKAIPDSRGPERFRDITQKTQIHDEIVEGYRRARKENRSVNAQENQRQRNIEMQRKEDEESVEEQILKGRKPDLGPSETEERTNRRHERDPRSWGEKRENEDSGLRINEAGQVRESDADIAGNLQQKRLGGGEMQRRSNETGSSQYPVRPGVADCRHYAKNGLCSYGSKCHFNHPPHLSPAFPKKMQDCKFFLKGYCKFGSSCSYIHSKEKDVAAEPMPQAQARAIPDSQERDPREFFQYVTDDTAVDYKRVGIEHEGEILLGWQRMEAEDIVQEQRQAQEIVQEQRQAQFNVQREVEESVEERIMRVNKLKQDSDSENVEKERQIEIQRKKKEERLKLDQIEETAKSNIWNRMQIIGVRDPAGTESKEKKPARDIESERRESRLKLEQMKPTVQFNEGDRVRDVLTELGFERKEGDGF